MLMGNRYGLACRDTYDKLCTAFNIRGVVAADTRGASRRKDDALAAAAEAAVDTRGAGRKKEAAAPAAAAAGASRS